MKHFFLHVHMVNTMLTLNFCWRNAEIQLTTKLVPQHLVREVQEADRDGGEGDNVYVSARDGFVSHPCFHFAHNSVLTRVA